MDGKKEVGIGGINKEEYSTHLEMLERRIRNKFYRPKPARKSRDTERRWEDKTAKQILL